jgi:precorrin-6B methylase 2
MAGAPLQIEVECAPGLEEQVLIEVYRRFKRAIPGGKTSIQILPGAVRFAYSGPLETLKTLKSAISVYLALSFAIPRPRALLGDQHFRRLHEGIRQVLGLGGQDVFHTFYLSAAGKDSSVLNRLKSRLSEATGLQIGAQEGDLLLRLRRPPAGETGWEVLIRLTARPLATREWRVCNLEGALNASVARTMVQLTNPRPEDTYLNLACGSGTLLVERLDWGPARQTVGCDISADALDCARRNLKAAHMLGAVHLLVMDGRALPLASDQADVICSDLPFGGLVGSHAENLVLYPHLLDECARVARPGARVVLLTHEIKLMRALLARTGEWEVHQELQITLSGLHPCIFLLTRLAR